MKPYHLAMIVHSPANLRLAFTTHPTPGTVYGMPLTVRKRCFRCRRKPRAVDKVAEGLSGKHLRPEILVAERAPGRKVRVNMILSAPWLRSPPP